MNSIDFSPLYRNSIGFDRMEALLNRAFNADSLASSYPPYNIEMAEDNRYVITLAVAGFERGELDVNLENGVLTVHGEKQQDNNRKYLHQGIANRTFERKFSLAEHVEVTNADLNNGLLMIHLVKEVPEAMKPRRIEIRHTGDKVLEHDAGQRTGEKAEASQTADDRKKDRKEAA